MVVFSVIVGLVEYVLPLLVCGEIDGGVRRNAQQCGRIAAPQSTQSTLANCLPYVRANSAQRVRMNARHCNDFSQQGLLHAAQLFISITLMLLSTYGSISLFSKQHISCKQQRH